MSNPKLIVYTAIFGTIKDKLYQPAVLSDDVEYHAYMDVSSPIICNGWRVKPPAFHIPHDLRRQARIHKIMAHRLYPNVEHTLWLDGCFTPAVDPMTLLHYVDTEDLCLFKHCQRDCIYRELEACIKLGKDNAEVMRKQVSRYRAEGYPCNAGLCETGALLRTMSKDTRRLNEAWWDEILLGSYRDQLSFNYCSWRLNIAYNTFRANRLHTPYFKWRAHR